MVIWLMDKDCIQICFSVSLNCRMWTSLTPIIAIFIVTLAFINIDTDSCKFCAGKDKQECIIVNIYLGTHRDACTDTCTHACTRKQSGSSRLEVGNNKRATARYSCSLLSLFLSYLREAVGIASRFLLCSLATSLVTSKIITHKRYVKDWMMSTHERTLTERLTNTMCRSCTWLHTQMHRHSCACTPCTHSHARTHTNSLTHSHIHTHAHAHTHTISNTVYICTQHSEAYLGLIKQSIPADDIKLEQLILHFCIFQMVQDLTGVLFSSLYLAGQKGFFWFTVASAALMVGE